MARELPRERMGKALPHRLGVNYLRGKRVVVTASRRTSKGKIEVRCEYGNGVVRWVPANHVKTLVLRRKRHGPSKAAERRANRVLTTPAPAKQISKRSILGRLSAMVGGFIGVT